MKGLLCAVLYLVLISLTVNATPPNIVFFLSDDHSYPFLHCYGRQVMRTPNLDALAAGGIKFTRMFTAAPQCVPSRAAIMTGRSPVACRITRFSSPLPRDEITFPEIMRRDAGYYVGVLGRSYHLDGSGRGPAITYRVFEENRMRTFEERFNFVEVNSQADTPDAIERFFEGRPADAPYFLWVNYSDPHHPWTTGEDPLAPEKIVVPGYLPDLPGIRRDLSDHIAEIEHVDQEYATALAVIKRRAGLKNTVLFFMGDNGLALPGGKGSLYDPGLNVPFIVWCPGIIGEHGSSDALLSGEDIAPTCLELAGLAIPERISGRSFLPLLKGDQSARIRTYIFGERGPHGSAAFDKGVKASSIDYARCVRDTRYKLIYNHTPDREYAPVDSAGNPGWREMKTAFAAKKLDSKFVRRYFTSPRPVYELYDLQTDPNELNNLYGNKSMAEVTLRLKEALQRKMIEDFDYLALPISPLPKAIQQQRDREVRKRNFIKLDLSGDGKLDFKEFAGNRDKQEAGMWFNARDVNQDSFVSREEYLSRQVKKPAGL